LADALPTLPNGRRGYWLDIFAIENQAKESVVKQAGINIMTVNPVTEFVAPERVAIRQDRGA